MLLNVDLDSDLLIRSSSSESESESSCNGIGSNSGGSSNWFGSGTSSSSGSLNSPECNEQPTEIFDLKDEDVCGVVYGCCEDNRVAVGLMNLKADEEISHCIFYVSGPNNMTIDFTRYHSFALVGSKLFAIGGEDTYDYEHYEWVHPREVYSCDLSTINSAQVLKFEEVATLQEPKTLAFLIPYKDKLFILADPCQVPKQTKTPCEILLNLNEDEPTVGCCLNLPPFWKGDGAFMLDGHVVVSNRLYVCVETWEKIVPSRTWYCLDMDTYLWDDGECVVPPILKDIYAKRPLNYVYGDKLFELEWDEDPYIPTFKVLKLKDDDDVDLKGVGESMGLRDLFVLDGWVLPCDEDEDVFCLMIWFKKLRDGPDYIWDQYIRACKFKLDDDGSFHILTKQVVTCGPFPVYGKPYLGFTPAITKELNAGEYRSKLYYKEVERMEAQSYKEEEEAYGIQYRDDISLVEAEAEAEADDDELDLGKMVAIFKSNFLKLRRKKRTT
ncbi:hypothetical protein LINGRAPRIM_LOCUS1187 [Linum grandiflorum]